MKNSLFILLVLFISSCNEAGNKRQKNSVDLSPENVKVENHSYSNVNEVYTSHLNLDLTIDFENEVISGVASHKLINKGVEKVIFDIKNITIKKITLGTEELETSYHVTENDDLLGSALIVDIEKNDSIINIYYSTGKNAEALGWMKAGMTENKKHPFLYTQGEAILTRSWIPVQDVSGNRFTYSATIRVPNDLLAVMSAENQQKKNETGIYHFEMKQAVSSYLLALAVGDLEYIKLNDRCGVYAEPNIVKIAADEFKEIPDMINAVEQLYGEYPWEQYDVLVLPYSFPFGGMENPRLTFLTPTLIAGDGSLVTVIAHELAHSWSGNLVTNSTWSDFWLNEGFTVYIENRIMEKISGKEIADMLLLVEFQEMENTVKRMLKDGDERDTRLKLELDGRNPDDAMTDIAYIKGAFFLRTLEKEVGRNKFDEFLQNYFDTYKFKTITTEEFIVYLKKNLLEKENIEFNYEEWIYGTGIPDNIVKIESLRFEKSQDLALGFKNSNKLPENLKLSDKITQEWLAFIRAFNGELNHDKMLKIDSLLNFKNCGNAEIMSEWFVLAIKNDYLEIRPDIENFLMKVGRRKYLEPLYETLVETSTETKSWGLDVYKRARPNYHSISYNTIDAILGFES